MHESGHFLMLKFRTKVRWLREAPDGGGWGICLTLAMSCVMERSREDTPDAPTMLAESTEPSSPITTLTRTLKLRSDKSDG